MSNRNIQMLERESKKSKKRIPYYFRDVDKGSSMPVWYYTPQVQEEQEWVSRAEKELEDNLVPQDKIQELKIELNKNKKHLNEIKKAQQEVKEYVNKNKDESFKIYKECEKALQESYYTVDEMHNKPSRRVDPRDEAEREIHRSDIAREYRTLGRILGENTNLERLRKGH